MIKKITIFVIGLAIAAGVIGFISVKSLIDESNDSLQFESIVFSSINSVDIT